MAVSDEQLALILQASVDRACEMLRDDGGFLPFGTQARFNGKIEFLEVDRQAEGDTLADLYRQIEAILAEGARSKEVLAAALVANTQVAEGSGDGFTNAMAVLVEAPGFCRSIVVPYRLADGAVELGAMVPEAVEPALFPVQGQGPAGG